MDDIPNEIKTQAPDLLALGSSKTRIEFLPLIWDAAEAFTSPSLETRCEGLKRLIESEAVRNHSLIAYLLFSRLNETDIELRTRIVATLAEVLISGGNEPDTQPSYAGLVSWLSELRTRQIYALLQVAEFDRSAEYPIAALLEQCSYAGEHLAEILANRQMPLSMRKQAAYYIGLLGYIDAMPVLERLAAKLSHRRNGREEIGEPELEGDECSLLPLINGALAVLTAP